MTPTQQTAALSTLIMELHALAIRMAELKTEMENENAKQNRRDKNGERERAKATPIVSEEE